MELVGWGWEGGRKSGRAKLEYFAFVGFHSYYLIFLKFKKDLLDPDLTSSFLSFNNNKNPHHAYG